MKVPKEARGIMLAEVKYGNRLVGSGAGFRNQVNGATGFLQCFFLLANDLVSFVFHPSC